MSLRRMSPRTLPTDESFQFAPRGRGLWPPERELARRCRGRSVILVTAGLMRHRQGAPAGGYRHLLCPGRTVAGIAASLNSSLAMHMCLAELERFARV